jgi:hypothetical protein
MRCVYLVIWFLALCIEAKKYGFLLGTEGWTASGYGSVEHRAFTIHSHRDGPSLSHFILGKEERVNVDSQNRNDKDLWYFQSPPIVLGFRPTLLMFTMISFSGDFQRMNLVQALVRLRFDDGVVAGFPVYQSYDGQSYDGRLKTFYVQFIEELWISNSPNIIYDAPNIIYDAPNIIYDAPNIIYDSPNSYSLFKDRWYKEPFRLEILGDWTQGWETIGLDNVEII